MRLIKKLLPMSYSIVYVYYLHVFRDFYKIKFHNNFLIFFMNKCLKKYYETK